MMNINIVEDDYPSRDDEEISSPRKRLCLENMERKSWSLMDRRTDQEVLQEMGVSLLEPDDNEPTCDSSATLYQHKTLKRKHDIENVNPNINIYSPRKSACKRQKSPKITPEKYCSSPGPSKLRSPCTEKTKTTEQQILDSSLEMLLRDEETPLGQSVNNMYMPTMPSGPMPICSTGGKKQGSLTPLGIQEELIISRRSRSDPEGMDSFVVLSDEMMLSIFRWLPKRTLAHCMLVCKRWHRVASDESLWQRLDLGNKTLSKDAIGKILARQPVIVRLASSEIGSWIPITPITPTKLQYLDLSMSTIESDTLNALLQGCEALKKLSLESLTLDQQACRLIGKCSNLETLNLTMAKGVTEEGLTDILEGCVNLQSVNVSWCNMNEATLHVLVNMLPQRLKRLNVGGARILTDDMVTSLVERCPRLQELDLSDCSRLTDEAIMSVLKLTHLEHLAVSRCYHLPPHVLTKLSCMSALQYLEVWGMLPNASITALRAALPAIQINQFMFSAIARPTVGTRRTSIWGLRTRD